ncbi:uncharacterized protein LOC119767896 [Culex quinquefasciatus]|uniref:uncharacterized protein LOC119767896 n=1 Tax=Culex quinquefasciatus TaxID=7176 RepID=UPI0018E2FE73|nr:uncharacterized protein LOC119767896 [Culex quinquefasciatus]
MEGVPDQAILDAGQNQQTADVPQAPLAAGQQHHSPFLQIPLHAAPYVEYFEQHRGYVRELFRQQQEALQRQLVEMQLQQLAFMQHQQRFISSIMTSMKVQAQPCLDATSDSLGSGNAEEFETDSDGDGVPTAWHERKEKLLQKKKVRSLDKLAEVLLCGNDGGDEEVFEQQVLVESCARGYRDDVTEYVFEVSHPTTGTPLHSPPDPWPKPTGSWMGESVEFAGLTEHPLWFVANVNTSQQLHSAVIDQASKSATAFRSARRPRIAVGAPPPGERYGERILSKLEFEPPPQVATTTLPGEQQRKICVNVPVTDANTSANNSKFGRVMYWTVNLRAVRQIGCIGLEKQKKSNDVWLESREHSRSSAMLGSTTPSPSRFDALKQPTWSLGRPPEHSRSVVRVFQRLSRLLLQQQQHPRNPERMCTCTGATWIFTRKMPDVGRPYHLN